MQMSQCLSPACWLFVLVLGCTSDERGSTETMRMRARATRDGGERARTVDAGSGTDTDAAPGRDEAAGEPAPPAPPRVTPPPSRNDAGTSDPPPLERDASAPVLDAGTLDAMAQTEDDSGSEPPVTDCMNFVLPADCDTAPSTLPSDLRCTGLYGDFAGRTPACGLIEYTPAFELWSDGAVKRRWVQLPPGSRVDTRDPDAFSFPVGTQFWKEFQVPIGGELRRAETRLLRKVQGGWLFTSYVWSEDGREAKQTNDGVASWAGSGHTVPTRDQCLECHSGRPDRILGWDPILLGDGSRGIQLADLEAGAEDDAGMPPAGASVPGDAVERAALGYLHANCGVSCHNANPEARASDTGVYLQLRTGRADGILDTPAVASTINRLSAGHAPIFELPEPAEGPYYDVLPGSPARSLLLARMLVREHAAQMPPIASNRIDERGVEIVRTWIAQMSEARGYPAPAE